MTKSILMSGVGGQGTILAAKLLTLGLMSAGYDVKMSEIHGMSQRGGSVTSDVVYGDKVYSPVIEEGSADMIVAFEELEALRYINFLKKGGKVIVNDCRVKPMSVLSGKSEYPADIPSTLKSLADTTVVPAYEKARQLGSLKVMNVVLLGYTVRFLGLDGIDWEKIIRENTKPQFAEMNIKAFKG